MAADPSGKAGAMRRSASVLAVAALAAVGATPADAASLRRCGSAPVTDSIDARVFGKSVGCATARSIFRSWRRQLKSPPPNTSTVRGYRCRFTSGSTTLRVSCVRGSRQVVGRWGD